MKPTKEANSLTCTQANQYFFPTKPWGVCKDTGSIIQQVFNALASDKNLDFIAMSRYLNSEAKNTLFPEHGPMVEDYVNNPADLIPKDGTGWIWPTDPNRSERPAMAHLLYMFAYFEVVLYGVLEMKSESMLDRIDRTNNRIYAQL